MNTLPQGWPARTLWLMLAISAVWTLYVFGANYESCRVDGTGKIICFLIALVLSYLEVLVGPLRGAPMDVRQRQTEWESSLNWPEIGPKLIAALEDIDWALHSAIRPTAEAKKIVARIFKEIGRDKLDQELSE
jgi:hypothetical protein